MPISIQCGCGRTLRVKDELAGRKVRCPECSTILTVPKSDAEYHVMDVSVAVTPGDVEKEPDWEESESPASTAITDRPLARAPSPLKERRSISKRKRKKGSRRLPMLFINGEVAVGVVMIVVSIVWFVGALVWFHTLFFYPPVLLILGIAAVYKGCTAPD